MGTVEMTIQRVNWTRTFTQFTELKFAVINTLPMRKKSLAISIVAALCIALTGCSSSDSSDSATDVLDDINNLFSDSATVNQVKNGYVEACSTASLGVMADSFLADPSWREFTSDSGGTVVELTGGMTYDGYPADALIQFNVSGYSFEASYLGINNVDQSLLTLSALLNKMCDAAY